VATVALVVVPVSIVWPPPSKTPHPLPDHRIIPGERIGEFVDGRSVDGFFEVESL
jgi:hypothetical protein